MLYNKYVLVYNILNIHILNTLPFSLQTKHNAKFKTTSFHKSNAVAPVKIDINYSRGVYMHMYVHHSSI